MNMISATGRFPTMASPTPMPTKPASEMGVSSTRSGPNFACSPLVTLNTPPYSPMSSPRSRMFGSRVISSVSASRSAWV